MAAVLAKAHPEHVVDTMVKARRAGKVLVDWSQNDAGKSTVAPTRCAACPPTASVPLRWDEVEGALAVADRRLVTFLA